MIQQVITPAFPEFVRRISLQEKTISRLHVGSSVKNAGNAFAEFCGESLAVGLDA